MTVEKKIIGISKTRNIRESIEIIMKTHMKTDTARIIIEIVTKTKIVIETNTRDKYRDDSFDSDGGRSREKHCLHNTRKDNGLVSSNPKIK